MQNQKDGWDAAQYLRFGGERLRPAMDLLARVPAQSPARILDLGCGAGNLTAILKQRWPDADVTGVDGSASMLDTARANAPDCRFVQADISTWAPEHKLDLIYTNSTLQWLDHHDALFRRLLGFLSPGGTLAVQMPTMYDAPLRTKQAQLARAPAYADQLGQISERRYVLSAPAYYDLLRPLVKTLDIWETTYLQTLQGEDAVVQWASGSSLRPYLDQLQGAQRDAFREEYAQAMRQAYPRRADGATLLPFQRMFLVAGV